MKNKLRLVIFSSALHDSNSVMGSRLELLEGLRRFAGLDILYPSMLDASAALNSQIASLPPAARKSFSATMPRCSPAPSCF